jgi:hypothetical protein
MESTFGLPSAYPISHANNAADNAPKRPKAQIEIQPCFAKVDMTFFLNDEALANHGLMDLRRLSKAIRLNEKTQVSTLTLV